MFISEESKNKSDNVTKISKWEKYESKNRFLLLRWVKFSVSFPISEDKGHLGSI